jgi:hypothetical protein
LERLFCWKRLAKKIFTPKIAYQPLQISILKVKNKKREKK